MEFSSSRYHHFRRHEPEICTRGRWMEDYTKLHHDIMTKKSPPMFFVSNCGMPFYQVHNLGKGCSGWGNQLEVIEALLVGAIVTKRALVIGGYDATLMNGGIVSPAINWSLKDALEQHSLLRMDWKATSTHSKHQATHKDLYGCSFFDLKNQSGSTPVVYIQEKTAKGNSIKMTELANTARRILESKQLLEYWGAEIEDLLRAGCFLRYLFQPGNSFLDFMKKQNIPQLLKAKPFFTAHFRFGDKVFKELRDNDSRGLSVAEARRLVRLGQFIAERWDVGECNFNLHQTSKLRRWPKNGTVSEMVFLDHHHQSGDGDESLITDPRYRIYIAADNSSFVDETVQQKGSVSGKEGGKVAHPNIFNNVRYSTRTYKKQGEEIEREFRSYLMRMFLDFFVIGFSDVAIVVASKKNTFTLTSLRYGQAPMLDGRPFMKDKKMEDHCRMKLCLEKYRLYEPPFLTHPEKNAVCEYNFQDYSSESRWYDEQQIQLAIDPFRPVSFRTNTTKKRNKDVEHEPKWKKTLALRGEEIERKILISIVSILNEPRHSFSSCLIFERQNPKQTEHPKK